MKYSKISMLLILCLSFSIVTPISHAVFNSSDYPKAVPNSPFKESEFPFIAGLARATILADVPVTSNSLKITYLFENGVAPESQAMIKEGVNNFVSHFGAIMSDTSGPVGVMAYSTLEGGLALAKSWDLNDSSFAADMERTFARMPDPKVKGCGANVAFSVGYKRLIVIGAPCFTDPFKGAKNAPVSSTHELTHELQASINRGTNMRNPVWLCEGQASLIGGVMAVYQGKDYWPVGGREFWTVRNPGIRTGADLVAIEGETSGLTKLQAGSEYSTGAALSEYMIAKGGFSNALLVSQISYKTGYGNQMDGFREAFQIVYGQSLDDFYTEALPYVNYVSANPMATTLPTSTEAVAFINDRLGSIKLKRDAAEKAALDKAAAEKEVSDKAAAEKTALDKAAAEKEAAEKEASDKAAAVKPAEVQKRKSIYCVKGKLTKKITAVNATCPNGYKKK